MSWDFSKGRSEGEEYPCTPPQITRETGRIIPLEYHPQDSRIGIDKSGDTIQTLTEKMGTGGNNVPLILDDQGGSNVYVYEDGTMPTLRAQTHGHPPLVLQDAQEGVQNAHIYGICGINSEGMLSDNPDVGFYEAETTRTLDARGGNPSCNQGGMVVCDHGPHSYAMQGFGDYVESDVASSLKTRDYKDATDLVVDEDYWVRRITPLECGRLQGFPDEWTDGLDCEDPSSSDVRFWMQVWAEHWSLIGRNKGVKLPKNEKQVRRWLKSPGSDSDKYKLWGNGIALPCALFVFEGIAEQLRKGEADGSGNI